MARRTSDWLQRRALERAYPLLQRAAEILELEAIEPQATQVKKLRADVGVLLAAYGVATEHRVGR